jgi:hypothetical protein
MPKHYARRSQCDYTFATQKDSSRSIEKQCDDMQESAFII